MKPYRVLTDEEWLAVAPLLPELQPRKETRGRPLTNTREVLNGVLWVMHSGSSWSMLPRRFPSYQTCHRRFKAWQRTGVLKHVLTELFGVAGDEFHTAIVARMRNPQPADVAAQNRRGEGPCPGTGMNVDKVWDAAPLQNAFSPLSSRAPLMACEPAAPDYRSEPGVRAPTLAEAAIAVAAHAGATTVYSGTEAGPTVTTAEHFDSALLPTGIGAAHPAGDAVDMHGEPLARRSPEDEDDDAQRPAALDHGSEH